MVRWLLLTFAVFALPACNETSADEVNGTRWTLVSGHGPAGEVRILHNHPVTLDIGRDGEAGGQAPCNFYGELRLDDGKVTSTQGGVVTTAIGCEPPFDAAETAYYEALGDVTDFELEGEDQLVLTGPSSELRFEPS